MTQGLLGAHPVDGGVEFRLWAPDSKRIQVVIESRGDYPLEAEDDGYHAGVIATASPGDRYRFLVDGRGPYPDPASRYQPDGVHGPSLVVESGEFQWTDGDWRTPALRDLVFYELHTGAFSPEGAFEGIRRRVPYLRDLGITAIELMPVADFAGERNWGYDGAALFAPARCYGSPNDLRRLVNDAHRHGLAVFLDVVYNHFGPDGAYAPAVTKRYFSTRHRSPWGDGINLDGEHSAGVRRFFIENAIYWLREFHIDGLRLDATHALVDDSPRHFLAELSASVRKAMRAERRRAWLVAEDHRNLAPMVKPESEGGWGLDAVWADDFHHQIRRRLAGDRDGYFADFEGRSEDIAATLRQGWFYTGQRAEHFGGPRGTDPTGLSPEQFVICIQNHDQVGNRAFGDRLHHSIDPAAYRAASTLLLLTPETPLLFMGQEWACSTPFQYFTDHHPELGKQVTEGRRREFRRFRAFADPEARKRIPDPQAESTFDASRLRWEELDGEAHSRTLQLYRRLLSLRKNEAALRPGSFREVTIEAVGEGVVALRFGKRGASPVLAAICWGGAASADFRRTPLGRLPAGFRWELAFTTEDSQWAEEPVPPETDDGGPAARFRRAGAVLWRGIRD